jgi:hypothetical protein
MWTYGEVPCASGMQREVREVGPDDFIESDVDPHERTTCHGSEGRQLCCGPEE